MLGLLHFLILYFESLNSPLLSLSNKGSTAYTDGMVIKYSKEGEVEWAKGIGGDKDDEVTTIIESKEGGYAYFITIPSA